MKAMAHLAAGNIAAAEECFQRAVTVTGSMAKQVIEVSWNLTLLLLLLLLCMSSEARGTSPLTARLPFPGPERAWSGIPRRAV
jgi:hypothetical protein